FYQAEDGIRDFHVTGVQTCALPILKKRTNAVFASLKALRTRSENVFAEESTRHKAKFINQLDTIESRMKDGKALRNLFDELKKIQKNFKNYRFTRTDHTEIWEKLDGLFKDITATE